MRLCLLLLLPTLLCAQLSIPEHELDHRIDLSIKRLTDLDMQPAYTEDFLLADVDLHPEDPRRFYNFSGDLSGRYIEVMSLVSPERRGSVDLDALVTKLIAEQKEDGRFGDPTLVYTAEEIGGEHMALLWGNGRLLVGLMTYYERTGNAAALAAARKLGDFFIGTAEASRSPEIAERLRGFGAKGIICFTQYIEGLVLLARATGEAQYTQAAVDAYTVLPKRGEVHTHGYLTTLRGVLMLYELTGDAKQLAYARATFDDLLASADYTRHGAVYEYFGGHGDRDEGCSSADFVRLAYHLGRLTGEDRYVSVANRALLNALFYNQYPSGDFGHHYFTGDGMSASNPRRSWWCCTMHGLMALLTVQEQEAVVTPGGVSTLQVLVSQRYTQDGKSFDLTYAGTNGERQLYRLQITAWDDTPLRILQPEGVTAMEINGVAAGEPQVPAAGDSWQIGLLYNLRFHSGEERSAGGDLPEEPTMGYLTYGPFLMGINQEDFVAEPDWGNQVSLTGVVPDTLANSLRATYRHGGYPGAHTVQLIPIAYQSYFGHPYLRVTTSYTSAIVPTSPD
ncbi:beta-L-arabinofuranosidase domain-containing protein [Neolewinella sp.]|uniref:beta-L-arabinofuranosidase domain-containing protein n=1 Tax=Neolewinella sp. TaxID=2993543 RepID=UPI003B530175